MNTSRKSWAAQFHQSLSKRSGGAPLQSQSSDSNSSFAVPIGTPPPPKGGRARKSVRNLKLTADSPQTSHRNGEGQRKDENGREASRENLPPPEKKPKTDNLSGSPASDLHGESPKPSYDELMDRIAKLENLMFMKLGVSPEPIPNRPADNQETNPNQGLTNSAEQSGLTGSDQASPHQEPPKPVNECKQIPTKMSDLNVPIVKAEEPPEESEQEQVEEYDPHRVLTTVSEGETEVRDEKVRIPLEPQYRNSETEPTSSSPLTTRNFYEHLTKLTYAIYLKSVQTPVSCACSREFGPEPKAKKQALTQRVRVHLIRCAQGHLKQGIFECHECNILVKDLQEHRSREHRGVQFKRSNWPVSQNLVASAITSLYQCFPNFEILRNSTKEEIDQLHSEAISLAPNTPGISESADLMGSRIDPDNSVLLSQTMDSSQVDPDVSNLDISKVQDGMKTFMETIGNETLRDASVNESALEGEAQSIQQRKDEAAADPDLINGAAPGPPAVKTYFSSLVVQVSNLVTKTSRNTEVPCGLCGKSLITVVAYIKDSMIEEAVKRHIFTHIEEPLLCCPLCREFVHSPFSHRQRTHRGTEVVSCEFWEIKEGSEIELVRAIYGCFPQQFEQYEESQNKKDPDGAETYESVMSAVKSPLIKSEKFNPLELTCPFQDHLQAISGKVMRESNLRPIHCAFCQELFDNKDGKPKYRVPIQTHMLRHLPEAVLKCPECPVKLRHMRPHMQRNHGKPNGTIEGFTIESEEEARVVIETFHKCFPEITLTLKDYFMEPEKKQRRKSMANPIDEL